MMIHKCAILSLLILFRYLFLPVQLFPLLVVTGYKYGGYNFDDNEIGVVLTAASVFQLSWQVK